MTLATGGPGKALLAAGATTMASRNILTPGPLAELVHGSFRSLVLNPRFSCIGARAAVRAGTYRFGVWEELGARDEAGELASAIGNFVDSLPEPSEGFQTFVAAFARPLAMDEPTFEHQLWQELQALHDLDPSAEPWDPQAMADPDDPSFAFSYGGHALFVVGLHPAASRLARRFAWPTLVFNPHEQFRRLRAERRYGRFQATVRRRELALQGSLNPNLSEFGQRSEARQYAGRKVEDGWRCPFSARDGSQADEARAGERGVPNVPAEARET